MNFLDLGGIMPSNVLPTVGEKLKQLILGIQQATKPAETPIVEQPKIDIPEITTQPDDQKFEAGTTRLSGLLKGIDLILQKRNNVKAKNEESKARLAEKALDRAAAADELSKRYALEGKYDMAKEAARFANEEKLKIMDQNFKRPGEEMDIAYKKALINKMGSSGSGSGDHGNGKKSSSAATAPQIDPAKVSDADLQTMGVNVAAFRASDNKGQQQILRNVAARRQQQQTERFDVTNALKLADAYEMNGDKETAQKLRDKAAASMFGNQQQEQGINSASLIDKYNSRPRPNQGQPQKPTGPTMLDGLMSFFKTSSSQQPVQPQTRQEPPTVVSPVVNIDPVAEAFKQKLNADPMTIPASAETPQINQATWERADLLNAAKKNGYYTPAMESMSNDQIKAMMRR